MLFGMINRRLVRVKAFKVLYGRVSTDNFDIPASESELKSSLQKTLELYAMMLLLPAELTRFSDEKLATLGKMFHPAEDDILRNSKFKNNPLSDFIARDTSFISFCQSKGISWAPFYDQLKILYNQILQSEAFESYLKIDAPSLKDAANLFEEIYVAQLEDFDALSDALEDACIWWRDDIGYVLNLVVENLGRYLKKGCVDLNVLDLAYEQNQMNVDFGKQLVGTTLANFDEYAELAQSNATNWDLGRIVFSDMLIIVMGIAEAVKFKDIGLRITINEYLEIAKYFSTPKSKTFVNGVLNKVLRQMQDNGTIVKSPRGMAGALSD